MSSLRLVVHREPYALTRVDPGASVGSIAGGRFGMVSRLGGETTVVCEERYAPPGETRRGYRLIEIDQEFALDSVGVVASVTGPLAAAGISVFAFSVWSSDAFIVREADLDRSVRTLADATHLVSIA